MIETCHLKNVVFFHEILYLINLMFIWPIMRFCGWFDQRDFIMDLAYSFRPLLELLRLKFEFEFMKYFKFDVSKILLSFYLSSLLEFAWHKTLESFI